MMRVISPCAAPCLGGIGLGRTSLRSMSGLKMRMVGSMLSRSISNWRSLSFVASISPASSERLRSSPEIVFFMARMVLEGADTGHMG